MLTNKQVIEELENLINLMKEEEIVPDWTDVPISHDENFTYWKDTDNTPAWNASLANCRYIRQCDMNAVKKIAIRLYNETDRKMMIEDLNSVNTQCPNHPQGSHMGNHIDVIYPPMDHATWRMIFLFLMVFPKGRAFVGVDIYNMLTKIAPDVHWSKVKNRINADNIPQLAHDKHLHFQFHSGLTKVIDWRCIS